MTDDQSDEDRADSAHTGTGGASSGPQTGTGGRGTEDDSGTSMDNAALDNRPGPSPTKPA